MTDEELAMLVLEALGTVDVGLTSEEQERLAVLKLKGNKKQRNPRKYKGSKDDSSRH